MAYNSISTTATLYCCCVNKLHICQPTNPYHLDKTSHNMPFLLLDNNLIGCKHSKPLIWYAGKTPTRRSPNFNSIFYKIQGNFHKQPLNCQHKLSLILILRKNLTSNKTMRFFYIFKIVNIYGLGSTL